ncbi:hypothetical protein Q9966_015963 [Columba livia]|nr:hypothetical protein Q9966_015963 [Columba livia]
MTRSNGMCLIPDVPVDDGLATPQPALVWEHHGDPSDTAGRNGNPGYQLAPRADTRGGLMDLSHDTGETVAFQKRGDQVVPIYDEGTWTMKSRGMPELPNPGEARQAGINGLLDKIPGWSTKNKNNTTDTATYKNHCLEAVVGVLGSILFGIVLFCACWLCKRRIQKRRDILIRDTNKTPNKSLLRTKLLKVLALAWINSGYFLVAVPSIIYEHIQINTLIVCTPDLDTGHNHRGYINHNPTKVKAPAYTCRGAKAPAEGGCSPGPRYYVEPSMTRTGKYVAPAYAITGLPRIKTEITPGPSDYSPEKSNRHIFKCPPEPSIAFRNRGVKTDFTPGPGTYTLPRVLGPNTAHTPASPCYSMKSRSQRDRYDADLAKTPGPAALPKIQLDVFKTRAPGYTMGTRTQLRDKTVKPGPADYRTGRVELIKPQAPAATFGLRHSVYTTPLILDV